MSLALAMLIFLGGISTAGIAEQASIGLSCTVSPDGNGEDSITGDWVMVEKRREKDDVIQFPFSVLSVDETGKMEINWGGSLETQGQFDAGKQTFVVFGQQAYIFRDGRIGGSSGEYSGCAIRRETLLRGNALSVLEKDTFEWVFLVPDAVAEYLDECEVILKAGDQAAQIRRGDAD